MAADFENCHPNEVRSVRDPMAMLLAAKQETAHEEGSKAAEALQKKMDEDQRREENQLRLAHQIQAEEDEALLIVEKQEMDDAELARKAQEEEEARQKEEAEQRERVKAEDEILMQQMRDGLLAELYVAIMSGDIASIESAVKNGIELSCTTSEKRTTVLQFAAKTKKMHVVKWLLENGASTSQQDVDGITALHFCAANNQIEMMKLLLKHKAPQLPDKAGQTPIMHAARNGNFDAIATLLEAGGDIYHKDHSNKMAVNVVPFYHPRVRSKLEHMCGWHVFELAAKGRGNDLVALMQKGASASLTDEQLRTPLHLAAAGGHTIVVEYLVQPQHRAPHNAVDVCGQTPLHKAAIGGHGATVAALLRAGADPTITDKSGHTAALVCSVPAIKEQLTQAAANFVPFCGKRSASRASPQGTPSSCKAEPATPCGANEDGSRKLDREFSSAAATDDGLSSSA